MNIPVFHDDQHGTAIIVAAADTSTALRTGWEGTSDQVKLVSPRARGAAGTRLSQSARGLSASSAENISRWSPITCRSCLRTGATEQMDRVEESVFARDTERTHAWTEVNSSGPTFFSGSPAPGCPEAGQWSKQMAEQPIDHGARQSGLRRSSRMLTPRGCQSECHHCDRPLRLSEPGEQRPVFPFHISRGTGRQCDHDQSRNEAGLRRCHCRDRKTRANR